MLLKLFIYTLALCFSEPGPWTVERFKQELKGKDQSAVMELIHSELIEKNFASTVADEEKVRTLKAWFEYEALPENRTGDFFENTKSLILQVQAKGGGITPLMAKVIADNMTKENGFSKTAMESVASATSEVKKVIFDKAYENLKSYLSKTADSRQLAKEINFFANGNKENALTQERAALLMKHEVMSDPIVTAALEKTPYPIAEFLSGMQVSGGYGNPDGDRMEKPEIKAMAVFLGTASLKFNEQQKTELKNMVRTPWIEPTRKKLAYLTLQELEPDAAKEILKQLSQSPDVYEKFLALDIQKEQEGFDKSRFLDLLTANNAHIDDLVFQETLKQNPNNLLAHWLKRDLSGFVSTMNAIEKNGRSTSSVALSDLAGADALVHVKEEFKMDPKFYDSLVELVTKSEIAPKLKSKLIEILSLGNSENAASVILNAMKVEAPLIPNSDDINWPRRNEYAMAEDLKKYLERVPSAANASFIEDTKKLLLDKNPHLDAARTAVRKALPAKAKLEIEKEIAAKTTDPSNVDPCAVKCRVANHYANNWNSLKFSADAYYGNESEHPWKLAVKAKAVEFLFAVGDSCGKDLREKISTELTGTYKPEWKSEDKTHVSFFQNETNPDVRAFLANITEPVKGELPPHSPFIFAMSHLGQLLNRANPEFTSEQQNYLNPSREKIEAWLSKISQKAQVLSDGVAWGSVLGTYHYAALNLGYEQGTQPPELKNALEKMKTERKLSLEKYKSAQRVGYYMSFQKMPKIRNVHEEGPQKLIGEEALSPSIRSASARMVPFNLVLYKNSSPEEKKQNADYLIESLHHYLLYFQDNWAGRGEHRTHEPYDTDMLAPYYGPSTVSYAYDAITMLLKDKTLSKEVRKEVEGLSRDISKQLLSKFEKDGLLSKQNAALYAGAEDYENAFAGLALNDACRIQQEITKNNAELLPHTTTPGTLH